MLNQNGVGAKNFNLALVLSGLKVYDVHEKELVLEPAIKWAGNPNIMVTIKAFGLKATVQVIVLFFNQGNFVRTRSYFTIFWPRF